MALNQKVCTSTIGNIGDPKCNFNVGAIRRIFLSATQAVFSTEAEFQTFATWKNHITGANSPKIYPLPIVVEVENSNKESTTDEVAFETVTTKEGNIQFTIHLTDAVSLGLHQAIKAWNGAKPYVLFAFDSGYLGGYSDDGVAVKALPTIFFDIPTKGFDTPSEANRTKIVIEIEPRYWENKGVEAACPAFDAIEGLYGVKDAIITVLTSTTSEITFSVKCSFDSQPVVDDNNVDFEQTDFVIETSLTAATTTFTNNKDGTYKLDGTFSGTYTDALKLKSASVTGKRYETPLAVDVTIA